MIRKLLGNLANRMDPKFKIIESTGKVHKVNSVMFLKHKCKELDKAGVKYETKECW